MDDVARRNRLRATFDGVAERYDAVRPTYPQAVVDDLVALTGLEPGRADRVLEIGCGTGQLTVDLARRGLDVTAVELGPALAAVARRNLAPFPNARVAVAAFEEYAVAEPVDAVVAATSFHWIAPEVRLRAGRLRRCDPVEPSPLFGPVRRRRHEWELTYSTATHRALLLTYSNHLALPDDLREGLLDCIDALIDARYGGTVTKRYLAELVVAPRR